MKMKVYLLLVTLIVAVSARPQLQRIAKPAFYRPGVGITNGKDALPGQFPHQISYQWGILGVFQHACGGSIITKTWILTAGHCVTEVPTIGDYKIIAGITNLYENTAERQEIAVTEKIVHPDFHGGVGPNDVALLKLASPLTFGDLVKPISLPDAGRVTTGDVVLSGWGSVSTIVIPIMPSQLQTITMPVLSYEECKTAIGNLLPASEKNPLSEVSNICTGPLTGGISACSGDSGGPLIQDNTIVGIVSWGMLPCGAKGAPSVYTKVSSFIDFIGQHVTDLPK